MFSLFGSASPFDADVGKSTSIFQCILIMHVIRINIRAIRYSVCWYLSEIIQVNILGYYLESLSMHFIGTH